jgi:hypothetical protein
MSCKDVERTFSINVNSVLTFKPDVRKFTACVTELKQNEDSALPPFAFYKNVSCVSE